MKKLYCKISFIIPAAMIFLFAFMSWAQTPVIKGKGSYASTIPSDEDAAVITAMNSFSSLQLADGITKPMPTNDWWTAITNTQYGGQLWANPSMIVPKNFGFILYYPKNFDQGDMKVENPINIKGWAPAKTKAKDWSDWMVTVNMEETTAKTMDITMAHGIPYVYTQFKGFNMQIEFPISATFPAPTFFKLDGTAAAFPYTSDVLGFTYMNASYSVCVPVNSQFTVVTTATTTTVTITQTNLGQQYAVFGLLPQTSDIATFYKYGYSLPTATTLTYNYTPAQAKVTSKWAITTTNLKGGTELGIIQGFAPHHYKYSTYAFPFTALEYRQHFGKIKCATGNVFDFSYDFNGCLAQMPVPVTTGVPYDYSTVKMKKLIDDYITTYNTFGGDTYAGAKDVLNCVKHAYMAKLTNHPSYAVLLERSKKILSDWMTYTPGEQQHYFAKFGNWPSMLGLNSSYFSYNHTDNHFHYGYFTYSMALMGMMDTAYLQDYKEMIVLVAKQYANWDKTDTNFPWFRTFDPWTGHSWAGGRSSGTGNNQESTSEATQSWAGVFFLGNLLNDPNMQAAGAFGYMSESRATLEYWFDWDQSNWDASYPGLSVGILYSGGLANNTHFSGTDPKAMYGINWLHPGPYLSYFTKNKTASNRDWNKFITAIAVNPDNPGDFGGSGTGWQNVFYSYKAMLDPSYVCRVYDSLYAANAPMLQDELGGYIYYNAHSGLAMGDVQWNYYMTMPISQTYYNATTKQYTYVAYNSSSQEQICTIYKDGGTLVGSFKVPAYTLIATHLDAVLTSIGITAGGNTVPVGSTLQLLAVGLDQYGATMNLSGPVTWSASGGGTINSAGLFTATTKVYPVTITAKNGTLTATYQIRVDELARLSKIVVSPDLIKIPQSSSYAFTATGYDQYGADMKIDNFVW
ncbi:MAG: hypothetical protein H7259_10360, partial [Cytophagales bacterium]|nr:hypothetical protein [Cytophaga sp.]